MGRYVVVALMMCVCGGALADEAGTLPYPIVDTGQDRCYNDRHEISYPAEGQRFLGQDAQYLGNAPRYRDNGDGTVSDLVTGLMWEADPGDKKTYAEAVAGARTCRTGGFSDWRLPTIKEVYSLIQFSGTDPDPRSMSSDSDTPFIDTRYFRFRYGDSAAGDRLIDSQWATATTYVSTVMHGQQAMFGVNFADGRIKGYPVGRNPRGDVKKYFVIYVRGNERYGINDFVDNGDGTITDRATGLTWMQVDSGQLNAGPSRNGRMNWEEALAWAEQLDYAGHDDWRLPSAKELQSIVDYSRSPDTTQSPAIDPIFRSTPVVVEESRRDWGFYWTSTTHAGAASAHQAAYVAFGRAYGYMTDPQTGRQTLLDVHGAGAQRSDPKAGDPADLPRGHGPQGDVQRIVNLVRCVRGGGPEPQTEGPAIQMTRQAVRRHATDTGRQRGQASPAERFVGRLDRDGDGRVSHREFDGPSNDFSRLDGNGDGYISSDEAPSRPPR